MIDSKKTYYLQILPLFIYLAFILIGGIALALLESLGCFSSSGSEGPTLLYYRDVIMSKTFLDSLKFSLYTSISSSVLSVVFGLALAILNLNLKSKRDFVAGLYKIPIAIPHIVAVLMISSVFAKTGIIARFINLFNEDFNFGIFSHLLYNKSGLGLILVYIWKQTPFVAMTTYAVLSNLDSTLGEAAINLGASRYQVIRHILIPLSLPTVFSSFIIILAFSFGAYEVPFLIGPTTPKALPVQAFIEYTNPLLSNRPYAMVYNILISAINIMMICLLIYVFNKLKEKR